MQSVSARRHADTVGLRDCVNHRDSKQHNSSLAFLFSGNTVKRVAIILSSILVFRNKLTAQGIAGSAMAVGGVLLYSIAKAKCVTRKTN